MTPAPPRGTERAERVRMTAPAFNAEKFRAWRLKRGIGQDEIARRLRYDRTSVSAIERGRRKPTARFIELLAVAFKVNPETFHDDGHRKR